LDQLEVAEKDLEEMDKRKKAPAAQQAAVSIAQWHVLTDLPTCIVLIKLDCQAQWETAAQRAAESTEQLAVCDVNRYNMIHNID
jgi:hypothetical protein